MCIFIPDSEHKLVSGLIFWEMKFFIPIRIVCVQLSSCCNSGPLLTCNFQFNKKVWRFPEFPRLGLQI